MPDSHPLQRILQDAKRSAESKAAALAAKLTLASELEAQVRNAWDQRKSMLEGEIARANAVLAQHAVPERFTLRAIADVGAGVIERCSLALGVAGEPPRAEYDVTVLASDGRITLFHRASGQRHQNLFALSATEKDWEVTIVRLYEDHLKKGGEKDVQPGAANQQAVHKR